MSLDVYLTVAEPVEQVQEQGVFVRVDGQTREISFEEWNRLNPDRAVPMTPEMTDSDPVVLTNEVFWGNITHNLAPMAEEAGVYLALWRPKEHVDPELRRKILEKSAAKLYHEPGGAYDLERRAPKVNAVELIPALSEGLSLLRGDPERFKKLNPKNEWGSYEVLLEFVEKYLAACREYPDAEVGVSR